ncbi:MAG: N-acyl homoserine lactonase family protein [Deltaproteobacteria bacterium]|nr:N-acyl homoserine lactonase family protein [Deltaproteobacteria bacterium]
MLLWDIKVLYYGEVTIPKALATPNLDPDLLIASPYLGFLLQNGKHRILVDTGISDNYIVDGKTTWGNLPAKGGRVYVEKALAKAEVDPLEIETILFTHLHNDHAANTSIFRNARLIFQKSEWAALLDPLPIVKARKEYDPALVDELKFANCVKVHGDFELTEGIRCFLTPGHTPGCMSVAVNTARGIRILVGDQWPLYCMAFSQQNELIDMEGKRHKITPAPEVYGHFIPPSNLIYNYFDYYDSCYKILSMIPYDSPEYIVPGHEPALVATGV